MEIIKAVATNIITGFLGVGKTTAILHLLSNKPSSERWAVLINEFGEIGIDGSLISDKHSHQDGVYISEVPGGCICCAAGVPLQVALKNLLRHSKPDRLLIEPTGLGHPKQIVKVLSSPINQSSIQLQATITLIDARNINDSRYTSHNIFNQQIDIADIIIANKSESYQPQDKKALQAYLVDKNIQKSVEYISQGRINLKLLSTETKVTSRTSPLSLKNPEHQSISSTITTASEDPSFPASGYLTTNKQENGMFSKGWVFSSNFIFNYEAISQFLHALKVERVKAIINTSKGTFGYNKIGKEISESALQPVPTSKIELISVKALPDIENDFIAMKVIG